MQPGPKPKHGTEANTQKHHAWSMAEMANDAEIQALYISTQPTHTCDNNTIQQQFSPSCTSSQRKAEAMPEADSLLDSQMVTSHQTHILDNGITSGLHDNIRLCI